MAIQLSKNGNAVKFDFDDNSHYLNDGTIEVPVNSLTLVTDESNMFTFKKAASDDIFISGLYSEIGMSKAELIAWYKDNMVGSTGGGGGGGVTSGEVQTMIDESISGKADTSDVATVSGNVQTLSGQVETDEKVTATALVDLNDRLGDKADTSAVTASIASATSGMATQQWVYEQGYVDSGSLEGYATEEWVQEQGYASASRLNEVDEVAARALVDLDEKKADVSAMTASLSGKQDTLIAGSGITIDSANTISCTVTGGGATYTAGRGIAIDTANTISFSLPIYNYGNSNIQYNSTNNTFSYYSSNSSKFHTNQVNGSGNTLSATSTSINGVFYNYINGDNNSIKLKGNGAKGQYNLIVGYNNNLYANNMMNPTTNYNFVLGNLNTLGGSYSIVAGNNNTSVHRNFLFGYYLDSNYEYESSFGKFNVSNTGSTDADKTLFSLGNGTATNARHNALEIKQNGDIYCNNGTADVKLQDYLQIKVMAISQADYDALVQGGTVDANTLYIITNVVN